jgi:uncharacterized protein (TIGR02391 family)
MAPMSISADTTQLRAAYARLKGLERVIPEGDDIVRGSVGADFNRICDLLSKILSEDVSTYRIEPSAFYNDGKYCYSQIAKSKALQLISYLEYVYNVSNNIIEIGSLYNSIQDDEMRRRCADLLSAPGSFDRVINQATVVLEDRIRKKAGVDASLTGAQLVNKVLSSDLARSVLKLSEDEGEHRGFCDICRGLMAAFRNPTHHQVSERFSREEALKVCAFIDNVLRVIDEAIVARR